MTSSAMTPSGLNTTRTPRGAGMTARAVDSAASKTTVVSAPDRATTGPRAATSRLRCASRLAVGQVALVTL